MLRIDYRDGSRVVASASIVVDRVASGQTAAWHDEVNVGQVDLGCDVTDVNGPYPFGVPVDG